MDQKATPAEREHALVVINNWRSCHAFPQNTAQMNLRNTARRFDTDATVAQRIKRLPSIRHKLERLPWLNLSQVQDIGGARAVVSDVDLVNEIVSHYLTKSRMRAKLVRHDPYIDRPKSSGYRGIHLVYAYTGDMAAWHGLKIEFQVRSRLQHAWATAVETAGLFTGEPLKSSLGDPDWLRFFELMSSELAFRESTPIVPGTPSDRDELTKEIRRYARQLNVVKRLRAYQTALQVVQESLEGQAKATTFTFLLELDIHPHEQGRLTIRTFTDPAVAAEQYGLLERESEDDPGRDVVLVGGESFDALKRAYPNYFADTTAFVTAVEEAIE